MKLAIMQPYFFPYIGYFQLAKLVDKFIFYDDVNYIKNGWINRNRILLNGKPHYITVQQKGASPNKLINEIEIIDNRSKLGKTISAAYRKAPYFREVWPLVESILELNSNNISELAEYSVVQICKYLDLDTKFELSSKNYNQTAKLRKEERLIAICDINGAQEYINPIGGIGLYEKKPFLKKGVNLYFLRTCPVTYKQFGDPFVDNLSMIDVMMFNPQHEVNKMLDLYVLE
jgi:hypothetical protein